MNKDTKKELETLAINKPASEAIDRVVEIFGQTEASKWVNSLKQYNCKHCGKKTLWTTCPDCE